MINDKYNFLFIHVKKTGGSSIERYFNPSLSCENYRTRKLGNTSLEGKHWSAEKHLKSLGKNRFEDLFKFCFVRNPWDLEVSHWAWSTIALPVFKHDSLKQHLMRIGAFKRPNLSSYMDIGGENKMNFVGRFENLQEDFDFVCNKVGAPIGKLPHTNKTIKKHYSKYYDEETISIVNDFYSEDIERFGYKFDER